MQTCMLQSVLGRELSQLTGYNTQVLVVRTDLKMTQGKIAAQYVTISYALSYL